MTTSPQRLMDLAAQAPAAGSDALLELLREGHDLYHDGLTEIRMAMTERHRTSSFSELLEECRRAAYPAPAGTGREEALGLLALVQWQETPAALAYETLVDIAAHRGVSLISE
ncbi:hypothetical protein [Streptomyces sp. NPDC020681]|uniref:hypothetical protein n=1 Tax=Streptomyces sp. NPDC020681 TaxID=3365083 RepID=UPI0037A13C96